jgi:hypothetical protein
MFSNLDKLFNGKGTTQFRHIIFHHPDFKSPKLNSTILYCKLSGVLLMFWFSRLNVDCCRLFKSLFKLIVDDVEENKIQVIKMYHLFYRSFMKKSDI